MWRVPFLTISACLVVGILTAHYFLSFVVSLVICMITTTGSCGLMYLKKTHRSVQILLLISLISGASVRFHTSQNHLPADHITFAEIDSLEAIEGSILEVHQLPENKYRLILCLSRLRLNSKWRTTNGRILVSARQLAQQPKYGDIIRLNGKLERIPRKRNPGQFDYRSYMARQDIYFRMNISADSNYVPLPVHNKNVLRSIFIESLRSYCQKTFSTYLQEPAQSLAYALFLGEKQGLDTDTINRFKQTGVVHVLAISGLHVGFIIVFVLALSSLIRIPQRYRIFILITVLVIYVVLINMRPPVIRASLMAILILTSKRLQRCVNVQNIILAAATFILLIDPRQLFNPGFQFSFVAVLSITNGYDAFNRFLPLADWLKKQNHHERFYRLILNSIWIPFLVSLSATIGTLPLTWYYYGFIPLYAVLANLFVIPLTGILVLLIIFLLLVAAISSYIAFGIAGIFMLVYRILLYIIEIFSGLPFVSVECTIPPALFIIALLILIFLFFHIRMKFARAVFLPLSLILILILIIPGLPARSLHVAILDVGQGDAAVVEFPNKQTMLIDAGDRNRHWDNGSQVVIPYLKKRKLRHLNYVVLSHAHNDHLGGMHSVIRRLRVDTVVTTEYEYRSRSYLSFLNFCNKKNIPVRRVIRGDQLYPDSTCRVYVLHPDSHFVNTPHQDGSACNNSSIVLKILYGKNGLLFTGDAELEAERSFITYGNFLSSEFIKIGHHGSKTSTSALFLNEVKPLCAVVSVGEKNRFNHPYPITLARLFSCTLRVYQTRKSGALVFEITPELIKKVSW